MRKTTFWTVGLSMAVVSITSTSCKKKTEDPSPESPSPETAPLVFRPKKVFFGPDSAQAKLSVEYSYDELGRLKERIVYNENMQSQIDYIKETSSYSPSLVYVKKTLLNHEDQKYYLAGVDSLILQNNRIVRTASFCTLYPNILSGDDTGPHSRSTFTYKDSDSLEIEAYRNISLFDAEMETARYRFFRNGRLKEFVTTKEGESSPWLSYKVIDYAGVNGKFERGTNPFETSGVESIDLSTEVSYDINSGFISTGYIRWQFDPQKRPIAATYLIKTGTDSTKSYYRFEY